MRKIEKALQCVWIICFILLLSTVFVISDELVNGIVAGKTFYFIGITAFICSITLVTSIIYKQKVTFNSFDATIFFMFIAGLVLILLREHKISNQFIILSNLFLLYINLKFFISQNRWNAYHLVCFFIITGFVEAIWGMCQLYGLTSSFHDNFKTTGSFFNPGPYAGYLATILPIAFYYLLSDYYAIKRNIQIKKSYQWRWTISAMTSVCIILILPATMSRAAWIAASIGCLISIVGWFCKKYTKPIKLLAKKIKKNTLLVTICLSILTMIIFSYTYHIKKDSADGRLLIWKISLEIIKEKPFGVGIGNFSGIYGKKQAEYFSLNESSKQEQLIAGNPKYAFNEYLQICIEWGIIPFLLFIILIILIIRIAIKNKKYDYLGGIVSILIFAFFSYPFKILPLLISFILLCSLCNTKRHYKSNKTAKLSYQIIYLTIITIISIINSYISYPTFIAYQKWNKAQLLYSANFNKDALGKYQNLYFFLYHEEQFLFEYAQCLAKNNCYELSNQVLEKAMIISCDPMLYNIMGKNQQALGNYKAAENSFITASMIVPNRIYSYYLLAKLYHETGNIHKICKIVDILDNKDVKIHSIAIDQIKEEIKALCKIQHNHQVIKEENN